VLGTTAHAQKLPALREVPDALPVEAYTKFSQQRAQLEVELKAFQADAKAFNEKRAENQSDTEYQALQGRKMKYIEKVKAFNEEVKAKGLANVSAATQTYIIQLEQIN